MCISPNFIWQLVGPKWEKIPTSCKKCWRCRSNRVSDYVGRALCEAHLSKKTVAVTLTYAPRNDLAEVEITPRHFQEFIRALRIRGHSVRYIATAEKGGLNGRVHFHAVLFFADTFPDMPHKQNFHMEEWSDNPRGKRGKHGRPHGHVWADHDADEKALRYTLKYIQKEGAFGPHAPGQHWMTLSKKPTLGWGFFEAKAESLFSHGIMPRSFDYLPPGGQTGRSYHMTGATRRDYLRYLIRLYSESGINKKTLNEWVLKSLEKAELFDFRQAIANYQPADEFEQEMLDRASHFDRVRQILFDIATSAGLRLTEERLEEEWKQWRADPETITTIRANV